MRYRRLGRTGLRVSEVGFGGGGIGGVWGATTDEDGLRAVRRALELGINFFDAAPGYGGGRAERVLGEALSGRRREVLITTKVSLRPEGFAHVERFVRDSVAQSLRRLRTDHVDLLLVHNPISSVRGRPFAANSISPDDALEIAAILFQLRAEGACRFIGFTAWRCNASALRTLIASGAFDVIQTEYNLLNQSAWEPPPAALGAVDMAEAEREPQDYLKYRYRHVDQHQAIRLAAAHDVGVVAIRPVLAGILTDGVDRPLEPEAAPLIRQAAALDFLRAGGTRRLSEAAIRFCLMNEHVATVVPGVKRSAEIEEAVAAATRPLTQDELTRVAQLYRHAFEDAAPGDERERT
jgi:aryl-alcohol dehydrogenase-like predicted oxidoreductase